MYYSYFILLVNISLNISGLKNKFFLRIYMVFKNAFVFYNKLPKEMLEIISKFEGNPYIEAKQLRTQSIRNFIKSMIIRSLNENSKYIIIHNHLNFNEYNEENYWINIILEHKLNIIDNINLDSFLKRYKTIDDLVENSHTKIQNIYLLRNLLYRPRLRDYAKPDYLYDIEDLGLNPYWEEDGYDSY